MKGTGTPIGKASRLKVVGYAVVTERNGVVYHHDDADYPIGLGHTINVEFLEYDIERILELGYGQTVHHIKEAEPISKIFGSYAEAAEKSFKSQFNFRRKNVEEKIVEVSALYLRTAIHNRIQQEVYDKLCTKFGSENVKIEEDFVDLIVYANGRITLIEIKPFNSAKQCVVEGIGQLLNYYQRSIYDKSRLGLMIIGSNKPDSNDLEFIRFITDSLSLPFKYKGCEEIDAWQM